MGDVVLFCHPNSKVTLKKLLAQDKLSPGPFGINANNDCYSTTESTCLYANFGACMQELRR